MFDDLLDDDDLDELDDADGVAIGIDLGTTNSVIAAVVDGRCTVLEASDNETLIPSVVGWLPTGKVLIGHEAIARRIIDPDNTIFSAKRIIGQSFHAPQVQEAIAQLPYEVVEGRNEESLIATRVGKLSVPRVSAYVLAHLKTLAERALGKAVSHCVVTVPANFSDGQRAATRQAAELAGLEVLRVVNEPTAAALAHGQARQTHQRIAVFDFGGGTFDLSLLAVRGNVYEVIATGGDPFLGGDDIDDALKASLVNEFLSQHRYDPRTNQEAMARLGQAAEQIKIELSTEEVVEGEIGGIVAGEGGVDLTLEFSMTRSEFDAMIAPVVDRAINKARAVLVEANVSAQHVDEVILVGGSTRIPMIHDRVRQLFGREPQIGINPMHAVALGAAIQAQNLFAPDTADGLLMDITPHSFGIATAGGFCDSIVGKNSRLPAEGQKVFSTARDNQSAVVIKVCQGEAERFSENVPVGDLRLTGLPPHRRGDLKIQVTFLVDADGILQVSAKNMTTGESTNATLSTIGLSEER